MKYFPDVAALRKVLGVVFESAPGEPGQALLVDSLESQMGFTRQQASLFASTVLSQNANGSADWVAMNAADVVGNWVRGEMQGTGAAWLNTMTETWTFRAELTYEHKHAKYDGETTPFGNAYSSTSADVENGVWAPGDRLGSDVSIVAISAAGWARRLELKWLDKDVFLHRMCLIDQDRFSRR